MNPPGKCELDPENETGGSGGALPLESADSAGTGVPAEVHMETFVRGGSLDAIVDANMKVDRCLRAGAMAMGAEVEINTHQGRRRGERR